VEAQGKVLEKIINCLSKIEEDDLKEEQDKADHGQSELTQEDIDRMMTEGKVRLLVPNFMSQLKSAPRP